MSANLAKATVDGLLALSETSKDWIVAVVFLVLAFVVAFVVDRLLARRASVFAEAVARGELSPETDTRLRFLRRLVYAVIILIGLALALAQFDGINKLAASLLASGAIAAAILGFAARQTLANFVAGVMLAVTQPLRVGDWVYVGENYGVVEDIRLTYTFLRTAGGQSVVIPNEKLASDILRNDTLGEGTVTPDVGIWLPLTTDAARAVEVLGEETGHSVNVAETAVDGVRLAVSGDPCAPPDRGPRENELRLQCLRRLRAEGLLPAAE